MKRYLAGRIARIRAIVFNLGTATIAHPSEVRLHKSVGLLIPRIGPMKGGLWEVLTPPDFALDDDRIGVPMLSAGAIRANGMVSAVGKQTRPCCRGITRHWNQTAASRFTECRA